MKTAIFAAAALAMGALGLSACGEDASPPQATAEPDAPEGISIAEGRLVLPAVKGNPGAAYFTVHNDSDSEKTIRSAFVTGARSAMIHRMAMNGGVAAMQDVMQIEVPANGELAFEPGELHVMAMDLDDTLAAGGTTEVTLTFDGGDKASFPVEILAAGDAR